MKRRRLASVIAAAAALPALGLGLNGAASAQAIPAGSYSKQTVVPGVHPAYVHNQPATFSDTLYP